MSSALDGSDLGAKAEFLELLLRATQDGIVDWNLQTSEVTYNARWKHLLGFDGSELSPEATNRTPGAP